MTPSTSGSLHGRPPESKAAGDLGLIGLKVLNKMIGLVLLLAEMKADDVTMIDLKTEFTAVSDPGLFGLMMNELEKASDLILAAIKADFDGNFFDDFKASGDKLEDVKKNDFKADFDKLKDVKKTDSMIIGIKGGDCATKVYFCNGI
jgi:hypothetical protein